MNRGTSRTASILAASAAALAAAAVWNNYRARQEEEHHPPAGQFITVDGTRLHYIQKGKGPPLVLLHGNIVTVEDWVWSGILDRLARHHTVIAFDRPGYGFSDRPPGRLWTPEQQADLLVEALHQLGVVTPVVVGHSWGTLVALEMALQNGASGLVLISGYYQPTARIDMPMMAASGLPVVGDLLCHTVSPLVGAAMLPATLNAMFSPRPVPVCFSEKFPQGFPVRPSQIRAEAQDAAVMARGAIDMVDDLRDIGVPVAILAGEDDRIADYADHSEWFAEQIPGSNLQIIPEVGHMLHYAVPNTVSIAVDSVSQKAKQWLLTEALASEGKTESKTEDVTVVV